MRSLIALCVVCLLAGSTMAAMETVSFTGVESQGAAGIASYSATLTGGYTLGTIDWSGFATALQTYTWGNELMLGISGPLGSATFTLGTGTSYAPGAAFSGSSAAYVGLGNPAGVWTFDFYESYDDGSNLLPDAIWDYIDFSFNQHVIDTDEADFLALLASPYYLEDFDAFSYGSYTDPSINMGPVNGYSYTISAAEGLWSGDGNMSTNDANDTLDFTFTGDPVTAIGGYFFGGDINGYYVTSEVTITLSDGTVVTWTPNGEDDFEYFFSDVPILSMSVGANHPLGNPVWPTVDHLYVGQQIPEPAGLLLLGLASLFIRRR